MIAEDAHWKCAAVTIQKKEAIAETGQLFMAGHKITLVQDILTIADVACWCICFWWMHRISSRQDAVLDQLRKQAARIEKISKEQHAILSEVHPNVESIQKTVDEVSDDVARVKGRVEK